MWYKGEEIFTTSSKHAVVLSLNSIVFLVYRNNLKWVQEHIVFIYPDILKTKLQCLGMYKFNKNIPHPSRSGEKGLMSAMKAVDADKDVGAKISCPFVDLSALPCGGCSMHKPCASEVQQKVKHCVKHIYWTVHSCRLKL